MRLWFALALAGPPLPDPTVVPGGMRAANPEVTAPEPIAPPRPADAALGHLTVVALVPAEIWVDGNKLGQLWSPATTTFDLVAGAHLLRVYTWGNPSDQKVMVPAGGGVRAVVGRSGLTVDAEAADSPVAATGDVPVEFRLIGTAAASVRIAGDRHALGAGASLSVQLPVGTHDMSIRSSDGTAIWASGRITVSAGAPVVIHVQEGRWPEIAGAAQFDDGSGG